MSLQNIRRVFLGQSTILAIHAKDLARNSKRGFSLRAEPTNGVFYGSRFEIKLKSRRKIKLVLAELL